MTALSSFVELESQLTLNQDQIQQFRKNGFIKLKNVLSAEVLSHFEAVITATVIEKYDRHESFKNNPELYAKAFQQISNIWEWSDEVKKLVFSKRLASLAAQLLGTNGIRLYHDQALYKEAGGGITPWHCDQVYWPLKTEQTVTVWIPLQNTPMAMGPLGFAAGSHLKKIGRDLTISEESEKVISSEVKGLHYQCSPYDLGEVSFHYGYTFHNAPPNLSDRTRKVMTMIYMDSEMEMGTPQSDAQRGDHASWLKEVEPGERCAGPLNPLLFGS